MAGLPLHTFPRLPEAETKFKHPFTSLVCGVTQAGKTHFILSMIRQRQRLIHPEPSRVIYSYSKYQPAFEDLAEDSRVQFVKGNHYTLDPDISTLLIIDDQLLDSKDLAKLFTVDSHHMNCSVMFVTHNLFFQDKSYRTAVLNTQYYVLFKSPRGLSQISILARQLYEGQRARQKMINAYVDSTKRPYGYLLLDLHNRTPDILRLKTDILKEEGVSFEGVRLTRCYDI